MPPAGLAPAVALLWVSAAAAAAAPPTSEAPLSVAEAAVAVEAARAALAAAEAALVAAEGAAAGAAAAAPSRAGLPAPACPAALTRVDGFALNGSNWTACEDLSLPGGALALLSSGGEAEWFTKSHEPYIQGDDEDYYLGLGKETALRAKTDLLGQTLLTACETPNPTTKLWIPHLENMA